MTETNQTTKRKPAPTRGGARKGSGRKKGSATVKTMEVANRLSGTGLTPLEVMMWAMREFAAGADQVDLKGEHGDVEQAYKQRRALVAEAAKIANMAAPFMHPRLQQISANVEASVTLVVTTGVPGG